MLRLSPTEAHWLFFKTNSLYRIRLYESNLAPPSVPLDLWAVHNDYGNGHINHIIAAAFILFTSLHKKRWRSCILMFLLMTSYHGVIKRGNIHRTSEKSCFYAAMEHDNEMSEIFQTSPRDFVGWTYLRRYYGPVRITVSVYYTQNVGQCLLWGTGPTVRAIWLCDATKTAKVMESLIGMMGQQMIET